MIEAVKNSSFLIYVSIFIMILYVSVISSLIQFLFSKLLGGDWTIDESTSSSKFKARTVD